MVHKLNQSWFFTNDAIYLDSFPRFFDLNQIPQFQQSQSFSK